MGSQISFVRDSSRHGVNFRTEGFQFHLLKRKHLISKIKLSLSLIKENHGFRPIRFLYIIFLFPAMKFNTLLISCHIAYQNITRCDCTAVSQTRSIKKWTKKTKTFMED